MTPRARALNSIFLLFVPAILFGQPPVRILEGSNLYSLGSHCSFFDDSLGSLDAEVVSSGAYDSRFVQSRHEVINLGYRPSTIWIRFGLSNDRGSSTPLVLEVAYPLLEEAELFAFDGKKVIPYGRSGIAVRDPAVTNRNPVFQLFLEGGSRVTVYLKVRSRSALVIPLNLWLEKEFFQKVDDEYFVLGMYYGILALLVVYNMILFFSLREVLYLYYSILVTCFGLSQLNFDGLLAVQVLRGSPWWVLHLFPMSFAVTIIVAPTLTERLLGAGAISGTSLSLMNLVKIIGLAWFVAVPFLPPRVSYPVSPVLTVLAVLVILPPAVLRWRQGYQPAKPFTIAIAALSIAIIVRMFRNLGIMSDVSVTVYSVHFGTILDAIFLSVSLADRVSLRKIEQETEKVRLRDRIARDLHDDLASTLGSISLFAASLAREVKRPRDIRDLAGRIGTLSLEAVDAIGDIVWSVSPEQDTLNNLLVHMRDLASQLCTAHGIRYELDIKTCTPDIWLDAAVRRNFFLIFKESVRNMIKHSGARTLKVETSYSGKIFEMAIADDGKGFRVGDPKSRGHGLRNIEKRAREINARLSLDSRPGVGTRIVVSRGMA